MANTQFEALRDDFVKQYLPWSALVQKRNAAGQWENNPADIKENQDYRVGFKVTNIGTETLIKNVTIRVANMYPARVTFYSDDTYTQVAPNQLDSKFPAATLASGQATPVHWVHFRLRTGPDESAQIMNVGVYAEIVPQGRYWDVFSAPLD